VTALYLQVFAVLALVAGAAVALGNEVRLWIDDTHGQHDAARIGRHRLAVAAAQPVMREALARFNRSATAALFAYADEAIASEADTVWLVRG
jgi:hypothetical protein